MGGDSSVGADGRDQQASSLSKVRTPVADLAAGSGARGAGGVSTQGAQAEAEAGAFPDTAQRTFTRLQGEHHYDGGLTIVKDAVRAWKQRGAEVFVPLTHRPGEAQVDFGEAQVKLCGAQVKVAMSFMANREASSVARRRVAADLLA
jgi:hypothetical protein